MAVFVDRYEIEHARVITMRKDARGEPTSILVTSPVFDSAQWIPWGQVDDDSPAWLANQRGWK